MDKKRKKENTWKEKIKAGKIKETKEINFRKKKRHEKIREKQER